MVLTLLWNVSLLMELNRSPRKQQELHMLPCIFGYLGMWEIRIYKGKNTTWLSTFVDAWYPATRAMIFLKNSNFKHDIPDHVAVIANGYFRATHDHVRTWPCKDSSSSSSQCAELLSVWKCPHFSSGNAICTGFDRRWHLL